MFHVKSESWTLTFISCKTAHLQDDCFQKFLSVFATTLSYYRPGSFLMFCIPVGQIPWECKRIISNYFYAMSNCNSCKCWIIDVESPFRDGTLIHRSDYRRQTGKQVIVNKAPNMMIKGSNALVYPSLEIEIATIIDGERNSNNIPIKMFGADLPIHQSNCMNKVCLI